MRAGMQAGRELPGKARLITPSTDEVLRRARAAADRGQVLQGTIMSASAPGALVRLDAGFMGARKPPGACCAGTCACFQAPHDSDMCARLPRASAGLRHLLTFSDTPIHSCLDGCMRK